MRKALAAAALLTWPAALHAQALECAVPASIDPPHAELPSVQEPRRVLPIGGYTLAITWSPEFCQKQAGRPGSQFECAGENRFGFTLHGLWPDGEGKVWPQYCRSTGLLPEPVLRRNLCATPSAQLLQHEWAKHGTCTGDTPDRYFDRATSLYGRLRYPDMAALSRRRMTVGNLATAITRANPGLSADMMRVTVNSRGWLDEIWFCLDKRLRYVRCKPGSGGAPPSQSVKIWRGDR